MQCGERVSALQENMLPPFRIPRIHGTWGHNPEHYSMNLYCHENVRSHKGIKCFERLGRYNHGSQTSDK